MSTCSGILLHFWGVRAIALTVLLRSRLHTQFYTQITHITVHTHSTLFQSLRYSNKFLLVKLMIALRPVFFFLSLSPFILFNPLLLLLREANTKKCSPNILWSLNKV